MNAMNAMNTMMALKALANDNRLQILTWLKDPTQHFVSSLCDVSIDGVCVGLIEQKSGLSQSTVSQYLLQLQRAELITMERRGQWTYCKLNPPCINALINTLQGLL